jgi:arylmalonate decarboxylase
MARKRRIGLVVPNADDRVSPEGLAMYPEIEFIARGTGVTSMTPQGYDDAVDKIVPAAGHLARQDVEAVMLMGTSLTFYRGKDFHDELVEKARMATGGLPVSSMSQAVVDGLTAVGARRVAVATAYSKPVNDALAQFLAAGGIETLALESFGITAFNSPGGAQSKTEEDILDLAGAAVAKAPGADGVLVSCGGLRTLSVAAPLERRHGLPVVTSTQSAFWTAARLIGESGRLDGYGRMLAA